MKRIFLLLYITMAYVSGLYASSISVGNVEMKPGETKTVNVSLSNTETNLVGFQMDLTLPDGITINKSGCKLSSRFTDSSQELTIGKQDDGSYRLTSTSMNLKAISGKSGTLLTLSLTASSSAKGGTAFLKNIIFATSDSKRVTMSNVSFSVSTASITVTAKSYTITYGDALPTFEYTVTGGSISGKPAISCNAGSQPAVGTYDIVVSQGTVSTNGVNYVKGTLTVTKATLTASVGDYTKREGENNPTFTIKYSGFKYNDTESVLTRKPTATCSATTSSKPGNYTITVYGGEAKNYSFSYRNGTLTVTEADAVTITAMSYTIEYGDDLPTFSYTVTGSELKGVPEVTCSANADSNAGTYTIKVNKGSVSNEKVTLVDGTLTIKKAPLTVSVGNYTKKQGDAMPTFEITYSGFKKGQTESVLTKKPTASCSATATSSKGSYPITVSGGQATNYEFNYVNGTLTVIDADALAVTAKSYTITYGDELPNYEYTVSGGTLKGTPSISCTATSNSDVGEYDIIVSQGSVSSYNVTYIKGKLTIKKATLTASVGNYSRRPGEENPSFVITYSGFKKGQNERVLEEKPTVSCDATKTSPSGTYPIILSGGKAKNYDFKYINGLLTVIQTYRLMITSTGEGSVSFKGETFKDDSRSFDVFEDEAYTIRFNPEKGFMLGKLTKNGEDITISVSDNTLMLSNIKGEVRLIATFKEESGTFSADGINYEIISSSDATVRVVRGNYAGHITVPASVTGNGKAWTVKGIEDNAFNGCSGLISISLPSSFDSKNTGLSLFTNCTGLAAVTWNASFKLTDAIFGSVNNPNLLVYVKSRDYAPESVNNIIVNNTAKEIMLEDASSNNNFYCPKEFTAEKISYTHRFGMQSGYGGKAQGWESIALPFTVSEITHESKGKLLPFGKWTNTSTEKPFWLCKLNSSGFARATTIEANTPYIICMPNNANEYDEEYCLSGNVTFSATNVKVSASNSVATSKSNSKTFIPAFCAQDKSSTVYALNVNNSYHSELGGYTEGSAFVRDLRKVSPFEAYMTTSDSNAKRAFLIDFSETTGIDELPAMTGNEGKIAIYNLSGQHIITTDNGHISEVKAQLPAGIYIINGKKMVIKR